MAKKNTKNVPPPEAAPLEGGAASPITVPCPEWSNDVLVHALDEDERASLVAFLEAEPDIVKLPGGINAAFLSFVTTDLEGNPLFSTEQEVKRLSNKNPVVLARLLEAAQGMNGDIPSMLSQHFKRG